MFRKISDSYSYGNFDFINQASDNPLSILDEEITEVEIKIAIGNSKLSSVPGRDLISYEILKHLPSIAQNWLTKFCNYILDMGVFPKQWKEYNICFIPKGKNKGYRPIALSNTLLKICERVINERLQWYLESSGKIPRNFCFLLEEACNSKIFDFFKSL